MERCFRCGISSENTPLYDAVAGEGIVKICQRCREREDLPIIRKVKVSENEESKEIKPSVRERLSHMSGVPPAKERTARIVPDVVKKQDEEVKKILEEKYKEEMKRSNFEADISGDSGLIRNFHWAIMRARRANHMTQKQLAEAIYEPEIAIRMAEKGILPRERERIVKKLEHVLKVRLTKIPYETFAKLPETPSVHNSETIIEEETEEVEPEERKTRSWTIGDILRGKVKIKFSRESKESEDDSGEDLEESDKE